MHNKWIIHSAKGSEWENHKYIKRIDGTYYYPDDYEGGRHLSDLDVEKLANETIQGKFGNGQVRKDLLGEDYDQIQSRVNSIVYGTPDTYIPKDFDSSPDPSVPSAQEKAQAIVENVVKKAAGIDLSKIYSVYNKQRGEEKKKYGGLSRQQQMEVHKLIAEQLKRERG